MEMICNLSDYFWQRVKREKNSRTGSELAQLVPPPFS